MLPSHRSTRGAETGFAAFPKSLRVASIYGANGSGKSNIIRAMYVLGSLVAQSASLKSSDKLQVNAFLLDQSSRLLPTEFDISFVYGDVLWEYAFALFQNEVFSESLKSKENAKNAKFRTLFSRKAGEVEKLHPDLKKYRVLLEEQTNKNQLFLSKLDQSNDSVTRPAFLWVLSQLRVVTAVNALPNSVSAKHCFDAKDNQVVSKLLNALDVNVDTISVEEEEVEIPDEFISMIQKDEVDSIVDRTFTEYEIKFGIRTEDAGVVYLDLDEESQGTQNLFRLAGPIIETLEYGYTLIIDELNQTFHTNLLRQIVELFLNSEVNNNGAQLIFTSHDTVLMSELERDEIWIVDKDEFGASELISLSEFRESSDVKSRRKAAFSKRYLEGRFGAVPYPDTLALINLIKSLRESTDA